MDRWLFKIYFRLHDWVETRFFYHLCRLLKVPHPKNLYHYRSRDFVGELQTQDRVADLGCGSGKLVMEMSTRVEFVVGMDRHTPSLLSPVQDRVEFVQIDLTVKDWVPLLRERRINAVTVSHVLEHIEDSVGFLKRLREFGKILICVPSQENWRFQYKQSLGLDARTDPTHFREYTREMLAAELAQAGFSVEKLYYNSEGEIFCRAQSKS